MQAVRIAILAFALGTSAVSGCCRICDQSGPKSSTSSLTVSKYNRIGPGMSYKQVEAIIGFPGSETSRVTLLGITTVGYNWTSGFTTISVTFQNDRMASKSQIGL